MITYENASIILDSERPYRSSGCGATDEELDEAMQIGSQSIDDMLEIAKLINDDFLFEDDVYYRIEDILRKRGLV